MLFHIVTNFSGYTVASGFTTGGGLNILTWQQVVGKEKYPNVFAVVENIFVEKQSLMESYPNISCYDMHYGKIFYVLT